VFVISAIGVFQTKGYKISSCYSVHKSKKGKVSFLRKLSQFNITEVSVLCTEMVNSFFHLYGYDYPHNCINATHLAAGTLELDDDPIALYLGYYD
jgi:hypothetical protein